MSAGTVVVGITRHFETLTDPRIKRTRWHELMDLLVIAVCGTICGCDSWEDLPRYAKSKKDWLRKFIRLENGIPSADTFARVFQRLNVKEFVSCMSSWVESLRQRVRDDSGEEIVAIDGKTMCGSGDAFSGSKPLHLVRAWAVENRLVLGQEACAEKSNEITAIPRLLELIEISGAIVTLDAMGCQTEIAEKIRAKEAHYVFTVKDNQPTLRQEIADAFEAAVKKASAGGKPEFRQLTTTERGHGRTEERSYYVMPAPKRLLRLGRWKDLRSIGMVIRRREIQGEEQIQVHYYIMSLEPKVKRFARAVRSHWSVENQLHWMLDVEFAEDASRIRKGSSPQIASMLRQFALMLLQHDTSMKEKTIRGKRKMVGWSNATLETLLVDANAL